MIQNKCVCVCVCVCVRVCVCVSEVTRRSNEWLQSDDAVCHSALFAFVMYVCMCLNLYSVLIFMLNLHTFVYIYIYIYIHTYIHMNLMSSMMVHCFKQCVIKILLSYAESTHRSHERLQCTCHSALFAFVMYVCMCLNLYSVLIFMLNPYTDRTRGCNQTISYMPQHSI